MIGFPCESEPCLVDELSCATHNHRALGAVVVIVQTEAGIGLDLNALDLKAFAVDTKVYEGTITSSFSLNSNNIAAIFNATLHELVKNVFL